MGRYTNWVVFANEDNVPLAAEDLHVGLDKQLIGRGFHIIGYILSDTPKNAIDATLSFRD